MPSYYTLSSEAIAVLNAINVLATVDPSREASDAFGADQRQVMDLLGIPPVYTDGVRDISERGDTFWRAISELGAAGIISDDNEDGLFTIEADDFDLVDDYDQSLLIRAPGILNDREGVVTRAMVRAYANVIFPSL